MQIDIEDKTVRVTRESGDPKIYRESTFLRHIARNLQVMGYDVVVKLMHKDGHMVSDKEHYIRERKWGFAITDPTWQIRHTYTDYNRNGVKIFEFFDWRRINGRQ